MVLWLSISLRINLRQFKKASSGSSPQTSAVAGCISERDQAHDQHSARSPLAGFLRTPPITRRPRDNLQPILKLRCRSNLNTMRFMLRSVVAWAGGNRCCICGCICRGLGRFSPSIEGDLFSSESSCTFLHPSYSDHDNLCGIGQNGNGSETGQKRQETETETETNGKRVSS